METESPAMSRMHNQKCRPGLMPILLLKTKKTWECIISKVIAALWALLGWFHIPTVLHNALCMLKGTDIPVGLQGALYSKRNRTVRTRNMTM